MNERRYDPTAGEWTIFATHRQDRTYRPDDSTCPLCPTPPGGRLTEIPAPSFEVAVFDNRFPSLTLDPPSVESPGGSLYRAEPAFGACEVVVYSDDHSVTFADLGVDRVRTLVDVWADRYRHLGSLDGVAYVMPFENKGDVIGVTLSHPHGQIYAYPEIPPRPAQELDAARRYMHRFGRCVECDVVAAEVAGPRLVARGESTVAFVPFWARMPYEVHVVSLTHRPSLLELPSAERDDLARVMRRLAAGYDRLFGFSLPYVMAFHMRPTTSGDWDSISHLHVEFTPRHRAADKLKYLAGSELAAGAYTSDIEPEAAAARLREALG